MAYAASGRDFASIEALDSDGDGFTNLEEINTLTFPGDPADYPQTESETPSTGDIPAPVNEGQEQETNEEPSDESASEQQSPGFGAVLAIVGILSAIYFKRKG
ncbi:hypothetical protein Mpsy_0395 [Methanolobus psychrophilus R15]|nr:hypothetical protein Mpsy_0395 [Methanolobus psychrophilus R15]